MGLTNGLYPIKMQINVNWKSTNAHLYTALRSKSTESPGGQLCLAPLEIHQRPTGSGLSDSRTLESYDPRDFWFLKGVRWFLE